MKSWIVVALCFVAGCKGSSQDNVRDFMPGMYVRVIAHEFATGSDTVIISRLNANSYLIQKRAGFQVLRRNHAPFPRTHRTENWTGLYDESEGVIRELQQGKILSFDPKANQLFIGGSPYQKVNP